MSRKTIEVRPGLARLRAFVDWARGVREHPVVVRIRIASWIVAGLSGVLFVALLSVAVAGYRWNWTGSLTPGPYRIVPGRAVERGTLVTGCLPASVVGPAITRGISIPEGSDCPLGVLAIGKRVVGLPGDRYAVTRSGVFVGGRRVGNRAHHRDGRGVEIASAGSGIVPAGEWFLLGDADASWDSRYYGPVTLTRWSPMVYCGRFLAACL